MARVAGIILLLILLFSGISVYGTGESSSSSANFGIFDGYNSGLFIGLPSTGVNQQGQTKILVECQNEPLSIEVTDLSFGSVLSTNYKNIKKQGTWSSLSGQQGFIIKDVKGACHTDVDNDGDYWDISIAFSNLQSLNSEVSLWIGNNVGYSTGSKVYARLTMSSDGGNPQDSSHLEQILGSSLHSVESVAMDEIHSFDGISTTILQRKVEGDNGSIGILQYKPEISIELPPFVPIGNYEGTIDVFISEG